MALGIPSSGANKKIERSIAKNGTEIDRSCYFSAAMAFEPASVDGRRARGDATRRSILARAMQIASVDGLDGLSLGRLSGELGMSKSGLFAHFGSKEELQLATLRAARRVFVDAVIDPLGEVPPGLARLAALEASWLAYFDAEVFAGGCLFVASAAEFDNRPGPVRDAVAESMAQWLALLAGQAELARDAGELTRATDPERLAWELHAFGLALNWDRQLNGAAGALERARTSVRDRLRAAATPRGRRTLATGPLS